LKKMRDFAKALNVKNVLADFFIYEFLFSVKQRDRLGR